MKNLKILLIVILINFLLVSCGKSPSQKAKDLMDLGMHKEAITLLKTEISNNPKDGDLHYTLSLVYGDIGQNRLAEQSYERALQINQKYKNMIANDFWERGLINLDEQNYRKAENYIRKATNQDSSILKLASDVFYERGCDYLTEKNDNSYYLCKLNFQYALQFWSNRDKDEKYLKINCFLGKNRNLQNIIEIDSLNIGALTGLMNYYWQAKRYEKSNSFLIKIRKIFPLNGDWITLDCIKGNTIIAPYEGAILTSRNSTKPKKILSPFEIIKYEKLIDNEYIIDFSGNVYDTRKGWITWSFSGNQGSSSSFSDPNNIIGLDFYWGYHEGKIKGALFDSMPKLKAGSRGLVYDRANPIKENIIRKGSIKLTGKKNNLSFISSMWTKEKITAEFREVTYECNPKWIESKYYVDVSSVIRGSGDKSFDEEGINKLNKLGVYSNKEKENLLDHNIIKHLTEIELAIALGKEWYNISETNKEFVDNNWIHTLESNNMSFNFINGLLESWEIKKK